MGDDHTIYELQGDIETLTIKNDDLNAKLELFKDESRKVLKTVERMQVEFATMQVQLNEWKQIAARYRILLGSNPLTSQGDSDAADQRPVVSPTQ